MIVALGESRENVFYIYRSNMLLRKSMKQGNQARFEEARKPSRIPSEKWILITFEMNKTNGKNMFRIYSTIYIKVEIGWTI